MRWIHRQVFGVRIASLCLAGDSNRFSPRNRLARFKPLIKSEKNTQRNLTQRFFSAPPSPPSEFFVFAFFLYFKEKTQHEHKEFRGLKAPKKVDSGMGFLVKSLCLGVFFGLELRFRSALCQRRRSFLLLSVAVVAAAACFASASSSCRAGVSLATAAFRQKETMSG